jgi:hypothetical protein
VANGQDSAIGIVTLLPHGANISYLQSLPACVIILGWLKTLLESAVKQAVKQQEIRSNKSRIRRSKTRTKVRTNQEA